MSSTHTRGVSSNADPDPPWSSAAPPGPVPRHIAGVTTKVLVELVRQHGGADAVEHMLSLAAEERSLPELEDETGWSEYSQAIRLLEAGAEVIGDPRIGLALGEEMFRQRMRLSTLVLLRSLGSPSHLLRNIARTAGKFTTVATMEALEVGPYYGVVSSQAHEGFPRHRIMCDYAMGLLAQTSVLFAMPRARVEHEECEVRGAPRCIYRVSWTARSRLPWRQQRLRGDVLEAQLSVMTSQFEALQQAATDLVSTEDVAAVLSRIALRAGTGVRAQRYLLVVRPQDGDELHIHHDGFSDEEAFRLAHELLAGDLDDLGGARLVVEVASARRPYGWLAAYYPESGGYFPEERRLLAAYARHAAAALDAATALDEARRRGDTSRVLLDLARSLAKASTREEVAERLAPAAARLVGARLAVVGLWEAERECFVLAATSGLPAEVESSARGFHVRPLDTPVWARFLKSSVPVYVDLDHPDDGVVKALHAFSAEAAVVVPIILRGEPLGVVAVATLAGGPRLRLDADVLERLVGLADQASTSLENARLLEEISLRAFRDPLTGLPNRLLFEDRVHHALDHARRTGRQAAVLFLDLDRFKKVNDSLGHAAGNELLEQVAGRLLRLVRESDTVSRLGGDEFTLLLSDITSPDQAGRVAGKVLTAFESPFRLGRHELFITPSIGVAFYPGDGADSEALLKRADAAMYRAKELGRNNYQLAAACGPGPPDERLALEADLHRALGRSELDIVYQPLMDLSSGRIAGVEALVRWHHPRLGLLGPDSFIPLAEETGLVLAVDAWVLASACGQLRDWQAQGLPPVRMAVNISGRHLHHPRLVETVRCILSEAGVDPSLIELEITESVAVHEMPQAFQMLAELRSMGVKVAIDDFGTGYSILSRLRDFPVDKLKIDRSFVAEIISAHVKAPIVPAMIAMAHGLGLEVVAEGVETREQLEFLRYHGCDQVQGYLVSHPLPAEKVALLLGQPMPNTLLPVSSGPS